MAATSDPKAKDSCCKECVSMHLHRPLGLMTSVAISAGSLKSGEGEKQWGREHNMDVGQERPWSERHCMGILGII